MAELKWVPDLVLIELAVVHGYTWPRLADRNEPIAANIRQFYTCIKKERQSF